MSRRRRNLAGDLSESGPQDPEIAINWRENVRTDRLMVS
jgi:hypothetical protein